MQGDVVTDEELAQLLRRFDGNMAAVARALGWHRNSVSRRVRKSKELEQVLDDMRQTRLDAAEDALADAVMAGEAWAVCFTLKTIGKNRGYTERIELGGETQVTFEIHYEPGPLLSAGEDVIELDDEGRPLVQLAAVSEPDEVD